MRRHGGKQKTYANVALYLKDNHPTVYKLYENAGMLSKLKPSRLGLTFLVPDKKQVTMMEKLLKTGKGEVTKYLSAHAIPIYLGTPDDWSQHQKDVPNKLRKKVIVEHVTPKEIQLKSAVAKPSDYAPYEEFDGRPNKVKSAVWILKGPLEIDTPDVEYLYVDKYFKEYKTKALPKSKVGGFAQKKATKLYKHITDALRETVEWCNDKSGASPLRTIVAKTITGLKELGTTIANDCLSKLHCLVSGNVAAEAFLIFDSPLFDVQCITDALNKVGELSNAAQIYDDFMMEGGEYLACGSNEDELSEALQMLYEDDNLFSNKVKELYESIANNNSVPGMSGEFMHPDLKKYIWTLDEFLITIADTYEKMCAANTIRERVCMANTMLYKNQLFSVEPTPKSCTLGTLGDDPISAEIRSRYIQQGCILSFAFKKADSKKVFTGGDEEEEEMDNNQMEKPAFESEYKSDESVVDKIATTINNLSDEEMQKLRNKINLDF